MNIRRAAISVVILIAMLTPSLLAAQYRYGKEKITHPKWSDELTGLVNDPARVGGHGQLGTVEFEYAAEGKTLNRLIAQYAKLEHAQIYLTVAVGLGEGGATLQIRDQDDVSHGFTIALASEAQLKQVVLPKNVAVEAMPAAGESVDSEKKAAEKALWAAIQKRVDERKSPDTSK